MDPKVHIKTCGRTDTDELFELSGIREKLLNRNPALGFVANGNEVSVELVSNPRDILGFADETPFMVQWPGRWRSDFFQFTAGDFRRYVAEHPKASYHVV